MTKIFFKGRNYSVPFTISCEKNTYAVDTTDRLGHGGNGVVYPCYRKGTGEEFAIKFIYLGEKGKERGKISLRSKNETCCLRELHHDHVIKYVADGILDAQDGRSNKYVFRYIIMDRAEGTLLNKHKQISTQLPSVIIGHIISVVSALEYIHRQRLNSS